jgi:type I restriction enzyme S subunit
VPNQKTIDWLGEIPAHWRLAPSWSLYRRVKRTGHENEELLSVYRDHGVIPKSSRDDNHNVESEDLSGYQLVKPGDLVMNKMKAWQGSIALSEHEGIVSPAYFVFQPLHTGHHKYFHYLLRSPEYIGAYNRISKGVRVGQWDLDPVYFRTLPIPVPPLDEQKAIADFLDRELAQIEQILEKNTSLISELKVKQRAVIKAQLGIKSESPDTGSRHSPVFEDFQNRWPLVPFKVIAKHRKSLVGSNWSSYQLLSLTRGGVIARDPDSGVGKFPTEFDGYQVVEPMELVFCLFDVAETPRTVGLVKELGMITAAYTRYLLDRHRVDPQWLELLFIAIDDEKLFQPFYTGLRNTISKEVLGSTLFPLPTLREQAIIVETVNRTNERLAELISKATEFQKTLRQRRDALISAAVTGKIEVQGNN